MVLNSKIKFKLLPDDDQPKKSVFKPNADLIKLVKVEKIGTRVEHVEEGDILHLYVTSMFMIDSDTGFCSERDVIFCNEIPQKGKVHISEQSKKPMDVFSTAKVINANSEDVLQGDIIHYREGQSHLLPDNTEILSETQIYYKER